MDITLTLIDTIWGIILINLLLFIVNKNVGGRKKIRLRFTEVKLIITFTLIWPCS